jgi:hypothetical protein
MLFTKVLAHRVASIAEGSSTAINGAYLAKYEDALRDLGCVLRAADQRGLAVRWRDWQAVARPPTESLTLSRKISSTLSPD